jgi:tetratricopeptide (TPR) repeat protein
MAPSLVPTDGAAAASFSVSGEMVDADAPATYRLPLVASPTAAVDAALMPLFLPPANDLAAEPASAPARFAESTQTNSIFAPAGSPPDERSVAEDASKPVTQPVELADGAWQNVGPTAPIAADAPSCAPATDGLTAQLLSVVQRGYRLAQRGALYAAREEFIQVLRRVAQTRDAAAKTDERSRALAAGLRAIDEADDFVPEGVQLEAELDVRIVASSHRTRVLPDEPEKVLPFEAVALYHGFAREQLAKVAAGEQAGSMALHGLGKIYARIAQQSNEDVRMIRGAMTMYSAALEACPDNHLAANELGVLMCREGRPGEAARLFERSIDFAPGAAAYHNLAIAQQKLGLHAQADANARESQRLAAGERATGTVSRRAGIQWVSPAEMARVAQPAAVR